MQILMPQFSLKEVSCITNHQYAIKAVGKSLEWIEDCTHGLKIEVTACILQLLHHSGTCP
jgi:hypothetical protein